MIPKWCRDTVGVIRPTRRIERGKEVWIYPKEPTHTIIGSVQPITGTLENDYRLNNKISYLGIFNDGVDLIDYDRLVFDNKSLVILGGVKKITSPTNHITHIEVNLKSYEG